MVHVFSLTQRLISVSFLQHQPTSIILHQQLYKPSTKHPSQRMGKSLSLKTSVFAVRSDGFSSLPTSPFQYQVLISSLILVSRSMSLTKNSSMPLLVFPSTVSSLQFHRHVLFSLSLLRPMLIPLIWPNFQHFLVRIIMTSPSNTESPTISALLVLLSIAALVALLLSV